MREGADVPLELSEVVGAQVEVDERGGGHEHLAQPEAVLHLLGAHAVALEVEHLHMPCT